MLNAMLLMSDACCNLIISFVQYIYLLLYLPKYKTESVPNLSSEKIGELPYNHTHMFCVGNFLEGCHLAFR